jgi:hypothetical protein
MGKTFIHRLAILQMRFFFHAFRGVQRNSRRFGGRKIFRIAVLTAE